jgi:hypothetical protein
MQASSSATIVHAKASNVVSLEAAQRARLSFVATWRRTIMRGDHRLSVYARAVACALAERMDAHGECWPGLEKIATEAGCSKRKAQDAIAELVEAAYLRTERKQSNHYFAVNARVAGDATPRVARRATEGNQESKGAKAPLANEGLTSFDLRESNAEGALALGLTPRPAPESEGHRDNRVEAKNPGSVQEHDRTNEPTDDELTAAWAAIEIEEQGADYVRTEEVDGPQEGSTMSPRESPGRASPSLPPAKASEPDWTAYRSAVDAAFAEAKRDGWLGVGRLDDDARWRERLEEIAAEFGVGA